MRPYLLFLFIICAHTAAADSISVAAARRTAARLLVGTNNGNKLWSRDLRNTGKDLQMRERTVSTYIFSNADGSFAAVAADDRLPPVLAYGNCGNKDMPPAMRGLLNYYDRVLSDDSPAKARIISPYSGVAVKPMRTPVRHQADPYNRYCPYYKNADGTLSSSRCLVGCVATALETILTYYRRTYTLKKDLKGWDTEHYHISDIPAGTSTDTRIIRHNYEAEAYSEAEAEAVARLSYHLGVAVKMNWGISSSGAYISNVAEPLKEIFGLGYVHYADSYKYRPDDWLDMLRNELLSGRPVFYAGFGMRLNGHAFVVDGLDEEGFFHVNWGLGGDYDGYFRLDLLNPSEPSYDITENGLLEGFFCNQEAVLIHPDRQTDIILPDTLRRTGRELLVDSLKFMLTPETGKYTPLALYVYNTANYSVATPLELFTNASADTAFFEQGDYGALTGVTLQPGEKKRLIVYAKFSQSGKRLLRLSPDDVHVVYEQSVDILSGQPEELIFEEPEYQFPATDMVEIRQPVSNLSTGGRAGQRVTYELFEGNPREGHSGICHVTYCMLSANESQTDTVRFKGLQPGQNYTLYVRCPWTVRKTVCFTVPPATGISEIVSEGHGNASSSCYTVDGRRTTIMSPSRGNVVISRGKKQLCPQRRQ